MPSLYRTTKTRNILFSYFLSLLLKFFTFFIFLFFRRWQYRGHRAKISFQMLQKVRWEEEDEIIVSRNSYRGECSQ